MKNEQASGKKLLAPMAAAVALSMGAAAQLAGSQESSAVLEGRPIFQVSMEGDIQDASLASRRKIVLSREEPRELELQFKMYPRPRAELEALAVMPTLAQMEKTVLLVNGTPGGMAVIHFDTRAPEVRRAGGGVRIAGIFDQDGDFAVQLPDDFDLRGLFAWGQQILELSDLVKKPVAGSGAQTTQRPEAVNELDLGGAVEQSFFNWVFYWTDLQLRNDGRVSAGAILEESASLLAVASAPLGTQRVADKIVLHRPRTPSRGHGHALPAAGIEDDTGTAPVISDPADPQGGQRAGDKIRLQRPVVSHDHVLQHR